MSKRKLFTHSESFFENAFVGPGNPLYNFTAHASAWKEGGDVLVDHALRGARGQLDYYFPVICFLYRHHLELQLKLLIRMACRVTGRPLPDDLTVNHSLERLLLQLDERLDGLDVGGACHPDARDMLLELDRLDPNGQRFRYLTRKDGGSAIPDALAVDVANLKAGIGEIAGQFGGLQSVLDEMIQVEREMRRDAGC